MDEFLGLSGSSKSQPPKPSLPLTKKPRPCRNSTNNPFYGHRHSDETKAQMSNSQKQRYQNMRGIDEATVRRIIHEELRKYI